MIAGSCAAIWRMPRNRPPAAAICPSSTASTFGSRPNELAFADRAHFLGTARPIARTALDEHGLDDVVAGVDIGQQLVEQIAAAGMIPEMMVRVDDRQIWLEDLL